MIQILFNLLIKSINWLDVLTVFLNCFIPSLLKCLIDKVLNKLIDNKSK